MSKVLAYILEKSLYIRDELKDLYYAKDVVSALGDYLLDTSIGGFSEFSLEW